MSENFGQVTYLSPVPCEALLLPVELKKPGYNPSRLPGSRDLPIREDLGSVSLPTEAIKVKQENQV